MTHRTTRRAMLAALLLGLSGCGLNIPADPRGTLDRITDGTLQVGVSHQPPWTDISDADAPAGIEVDLVEEFAADRNATVEWEAGGEEHLMTMLRERQLDMVIGGLTSSSPWSTHAALTTSYAQATGADGKTDQHVMAVSMGENDFMTSLERFLLAQEVTP